MLIDIPKGVEGYDERWLRRVFSRVRVEDKTGCWLWNGAGWKAVPVAVYQKKLRPIHRKFWELWKRGGMKLDQKQQLSRCQKSPQCVNPEHHQLREWFNQDGEKKLPELCRKGHPMKDAYVNAKSGYRYCRTCSKESSRRNYQRVRQVYEEAVGKGKLFLASEQLATIPQAVPVPVPNKLTEQKIQRPAEPEAKPMKPRRPIEVKERPGGGNGGQKEIGINDFAVWGGDLHRKWQAELPPEEYERKADRFLEVLKGGISMEELMGMPEEEFEALMGKGRGES